MRTATILASVAVSLSVLAGCTADAEVPEGASESEDALVAKPANLDVTLFKSAQGLKGCEHAELVTSLNITSYALTTYPLQYVHQAKLASFYTACKGIPVPMAYMPGPTVSVERIDIGCGSVLFRGNLPNGGKLEVFDHRNARGGWGCGKPSVNPVIVRRNGEFSYAVNTTAACDTLKSKAACSSRNDCEAVTVYYGGGPVPVEQGAEQVLPGPGFLCLPVPPPQTDVPVPVAK